MILILETEWNDSIAERLADGAEKYLKTEGFPTKRLKVPGALELPLAIKLAWGKQHKSTNPLDGVVACGCVIRGETFHFEVVATESARKLMDLTTELELPIGNAVLTVNKVEEADARTRGKHGNKGKEAAEAVVKMIRMKKQLEI